MCVKKEELPVLIAAIAMLIFFTALFLIRKNYEFIVYVFVVLFFGIVVAVSNKKVKYTIGLLWGLFLWALIHMSGGGLYIKGTRLYDIILIPISETYQIFKYDQFAHIFGFCIATLVMWHILKPHLTKNIKGWIAISIVVVMAGTGLGALNEIVEFFATIITASDGVGGYMNTCLDLISNLIGGLIALAIIRFKEKK